MKIQHMIKTHVKPKFFHVVELIRKYQTRSLLDVGCRDCGLLKVIRDEGLTPADISYAGVDLIQNVDNTVDFVCNIANGIPVDNNSYEMVVALDLLEHLDDFKKGLDELARVAHRFIVIAVPNMAHFYFRLKFLGTGRISDKYDLDYNNGLDRHRWLTVLPQTDRFFQQYCEQAGYGLETIQTTLGTRWLPIFERVLRWLRTPPQWHVWTVLYIIDKVDS